jgi:hypothetical protein
MNNIFESNKIKYKNCSVAPFIYDPSKVTGTDPYLAIKDKKLSQMRNLISIINTTNTIIISDNTFSANTVVKGAIYIQSEYRNYPVLISSNTFSQNAAYFGAMAIYIRHFASAQPI